MKKVYIEWYDSVSGSNGWEFQADVEEPKLVVCTTNGFLFKENDEAVTIVSTYTKTQVLGLLTIPKVNIIKRVFN